MSVRAVKIQVVQELGGGQLFSIFQHSLTSFRRFATQRKSTQVDRKSSVAVETH